jgi:hypothetical protein
MMRTTINLPDDVYRCAQALASAKRITLGEAVAEMVRRGLSLPPAVDRKRRFPRFDQEPDGEIITLEHTLQLEDEL